MGSQALSKYSYQYIFRIIFYNSLEMIPGSIFPASYFQLNYNPYENDVVRQMNELQTRCNALELENVQLKSMINELKQSQDLTLNIKKKKRRSTQTIEQKFVCTYTGCNKEYGSDLALNLHIKNKHNGGTKTYRQSLAREIVLAEEKGDPMPTVSINFPPGYLKEFRKKFFYGI